MMLRRLIAAIEFLTVIPLGKPTVYDPKGMIAFFTFVGIMIGTLLSMFDYAVSRLWSEPVVALLDVVVLTVLTGGLHLDGLADTADGLLGHRSKEKALAIMKDSRIGVMGLLAIVCGLLIKWGGIVSLKPDRHLLLIIIPAYARSSMLFGIRYLEYGRPRSGIGRELFENRLTPQAFWGLLIPVTLSYFLGWRGIWLIIVFAGITALMLCYYHQRMGCITGDMLGAMTEVMESLLFLLASMVNAVL
ncbi:MAG: adenosylcobinamide-GDP ribazoletransferase [Desulfobacterales bacterium]|nr:MAG: adenosylcobinamide-GDP ribazoletransferase [Desulfobacterales bacterium]